MSTLFQRVQPGDLITAADMNALFQEVESLETRVEALEAGHGSPPPSPTVGQVTITSISPDPVEVGTTLTIVGTNFGVSSAANSVLFNTTPAFATLTGSSDTLLIVTVPDLGASTPQSVTVTVSNALTSAQRTITVDPAPVPQEGTVEVIFDGASPDPITAGTTNDFQFHHVNQASVQPVTVVLTPSVGGQSWSAAVLDDTHSPLAGDQITLQKNGDQKTFYVRVTIPSSTNGAQFTLSVAANGSGISSSSGIGSYTVGQFADPDTTFTLAPAAAPGIISGNTVTASASATFATRVPLLASMTEAGTYDVSVSLVPSNASGWNQPSVFSPGASGSPPANRFVIQPSDLGSPPVGVPETIQISIKPQSASAAPAQLRVKVQREGASLSRTLTFDLVAGT
jgi:hypothetical protein